ncbi:MAG: glycosyltransferase family 2 protein [Anaerolineales bacterium]|nr:glycosyltransferase family 2 protein [Anaerolineales bacterium]
MLDLAIVIVSYKVCDLLRKCLNSVYSSRGLGIFEVCVVDNASSDGSIEMVRDEFPQARLIVNEQNLGYPAANNIGLSSFGEWDSNPPARYALLLNPDTELPPMALAGMVDFMDAHPEAGAAGPKLVMPDGQMDLACRRSFPTPEVIFYRVVMLSKLFPNSRRFGRYNLTYLDPDQLAEVDSVVGAFMLVRAEPIAQVGLLDEQFFMYAEDLDWAKRIKEAGWKIFYNPAITVLHVKRASSRQSSRRSRFEFERANLLFYRKHYQASTPAWLNLLILLVLAFRGGKKLWPEFAAKPIQEIDR